MFCMADDMCPFNYGLSYLWSYGNWICIHLYIYKKCVSFSVWHSILLVARYTQYKFVWWRFSILNYLCNRCLSPLTLCVRTPLRRGVLDTTLCDKVCQWLAAGWWFSPGTLVSFTNKTDCQDITEILLKVVLNTITLLSFRNSWYI